MNKEKFVVAIVISALFTFLLSPLSAKATVGEVYGINYARLYMDVREYEVSAKVGGYVFPGKIVRNAHFDANEIDRHIESFMEKNHITGRKLVEAEKTVQDAIKQTEYESRQLVGDMVQTIAGFAGDYSETAIKGIRNAIENALFAKSQYENGGMSQLLSFETVKQFYSNNMKMRFSHFTSPYDFARTVCGQLLDVTVNGHPLVKGFFIIVDTTKFCIDAYNRYQKLLPIWERGFAAKEFLDDFYRRLNIYLDNIFKDKVTFVLTVTGDKVRKFTFLGTKGNIQNWHVSFLLKRERSYGNRKYSPAGEYRGSAAIVLTHFMAGFDTMLWNLPVGPLEEWWFVKATALVLNGVQLVTGDYSGYSYISRVIESDNAKLTVFADEGNGSGYVRLVSRMDMSGFDDVINTSSTQKVTIDSSVGFTGDDKNAVAAAMFADIKMHLEGNEFGTFDLVLDKANAKFQSVLGINVDQKQGTRLVARVWDSNIWAPLQNKTATFEIRAKIYEEGLK